MGLFYFVLDKVATLVLLLDNDMPSVTIKEFQRNMYKYLGKVPLCITRYGKPLFFITNNIEEEEDKLYWSTKNLYQEYARSEKY